MKISNLPVRVAFAVVVCATAATADADQARLRSWDEAKALLWHRVYDRGGETLYCGVRFMRKEDLGTENSVEHVVPQDDLEQLCPDHRRSCERFARAAADLHNLWPEFATMNSWRSNYPFAEIPGESHRVLRHLCDDFERVRFGHDFRVEPRDEMKGEIARSILYMQREYGLTIRDDQDMLLRWHRADLPSELERRRNGIIEQLQGTRNPFIDGLALEP